MQNNTIINKDLFLRAFCNARELEKKFCYSKSELDSEAIRLRDNVYLESLLDKTEIQSLINFEGRVVACGDHNYLELDITIAIEKTAKEYRVIFNEDAEFRGETFEDLHNWFQEMNSRARKCLDDLKEF